MKARALPLVFMILSLVVGIWFHISTCAKGSALNLVTSQDLYINLGRWQKPPKETGLIGYEWTADATLIRIMRDGTFEMITCYLRRSRQDCGISQGDGQTIWLGKVKKKNDGFAVLYKMVMDISGVVGDKPEKEANIFLGDGFLIFNGDIYDVSKLVTIKDFNGYIGEYLAEAKRSMPKSKVASASGK